MREQVFIHITADVSDKAQLGAGTKVWNQAQIRENAQIGENCIISKDVYIDHGVTIGNNVKIQNGVSIYHGVEIQDDVFLGPHMTFTNDLFPRAFSKEWEVVKTTVERGASIGANATIVCGITIGKYAMVGAGAVVIRDVGDYELVVGNPARVIGMVCVCGGRVSNGHCTACGNLFSTISE
ncbi:acyltransferase [Brevibacillus daliensis]|uniref:acyltransferase n=1 Tax=Brevibacillus daliensis TaxID=2892995 RepID=UPI001E4A6BE9|nr:acyltransferase [Brevibacillus daliensis]